MRFVAVYRRSSASITSPASAQRFRAARSATSTMGIDFSVPLNTVFLLAIAYYAQKAVFPPASSSPNQIPSEPKPGAYSWMPKTHPPTVLYKKYTSKTLLPFDGKDGERILLAIKGKVFDVTQGRGFYGPGELSVLPV